MTAVPIPVTPVNCAPAGVTGHSLRAALRTARGRIAVAVIALVGAMAAVPQAFVWLSPGEHDPRACRLRGTDGAFRDKLPPSADHWFGTDAQGCDYFARVVHGARQSFVIGVGTTVLLLVFGTVLGLAAATWGGWVDAAVRRVSDLVLGIPLVVGAVLLLSSLAGDQRSVWELSLTLAVLGWPSIARIVRGRALVVMIEPFIEAARAVGATRGQILVRHVLPNCAPAAVVSASSLAGLVIAGEATLTYLGIGVQQPSISWGLMIDDAQRRLGSTPHLLLFPAAALTLVVLAFVLLGDVLRDALDPTA